MRRPLFLKIFLGVCLSFVMVTQIVWVIDSLLQENPSRSAERASRLALAGTASAVRAGGEPTLKELLTQWPAFERAHFNYRRIGAQEMPVQDLPHRLFAVTARDPQGHRYALSYQASRFDGGTLPPLVFDMGYRVMFASLTGILIFSALLTLYLIAPVTRIRAAFRRLASGDLKVRLGPAWLRRRDEIADLASDFNAMATRLEELVMSRDRLLADISHELRSPLARLQLAIALARQSPDKALISLERIGCEADKLEEMVGELLALTKLESGARTADQYFFVSEVAALVVDDARFEAQEKGVTIDFVTHERASGSEALVVGSGKLISRAIENIVRNGLRFSRRGDSITLELDSTAAGTTLYIRDQGPGVNSEHLPSLFEPFVQADPSSGQGYGLGLAIAKRAVIAHGGTIKAVNGAVAGLTIIVWLPASPDAASEAGEDAKSVWDRSVSPAPV